jgi:hypothetical protein
MKLFAGLALLAELIENVRQFALREVVDQVRGSPALFTEAHIQGLIPLKREPAASVLKLG